MRRHLANKFQQGLSLIELLITMTIAVILLAVGVPSFIEFTTSNTASSYANDLLGDLNYARSEAITRGVRVTVCHSNNASTCSGTWSNGWIVFANNNETGATGQNTRDADDEILRVHGEINVAANWVLNANTNFLNFVSYLPDGKSNQIGTFVFCKDNVVKSGNQSRSSGVTVNQTGRARMLRDTDSDGAPNVSSNTNLTSCTPAADPAW